MDRSPKTIARSGGRDHLRRVSHVAADLSPRAADITSLRTIADPILLFSILLSCVTKRIRQTSPRIRKEQDLQARIGELESLAYLHGTDKGTNCACYELYFSSFRTRPINVFEIGVGGGPIPSSGGGSLRMWRDYFPQAQVYSIDLEDKSPHNEGRVHIYRGSQADIKFLSHVVDKAGSFDIIIDDGSHVPAHIITSFEFLYPHLNKGGVYIVEDIGTSYWPANGGSRDLSSPMTTMNYFKRLADGIQWPFAQGAVEPTEISIYLELVHFWQNFIVLRKHSV